MVGPVFDLREAVSVLRFLLLSELPLSEALRFRELLELVSVFCFLFCPLPPSSLALRLRLLLSVRDFLLLEALLELVEALRFRPACWFVGAWLASFICLSRNVSAMVSGVWVSVADMAGLAGPLFTASTAGFLAAPPPPPSLIRSIRPALQKKGLINRAAAKKRRQKCAMKTRPLVRMKTACSGC